MKDKNIKSNVTKYSLLSFALLAVLVTVFTFSTKVHNDNLMLTAEADTVIIGVGGSGTGGNGTWTQFQASKPGGSVWNTFISTARYLNASNKPSGLLKDVYGGADAYVKSRANLTNAGLNGCKNSEWIWMYTYSGSRNGQPAWSVSSRKNAHTVPMNKAQSENVVWKSIVSSKLSTFKNSNVNLVCSANYVSYKTKPGSEIKWFDSGTQQTITGVYASQLKVEDLRNPGTTWTVMQSEAETNFGKWYSSNLSDINKLRGGNVDSATAWGKLYKSWKPTSETGPKINIADSVNSANLRGLSNAISDGGLFNVTYSEKQVTLTHTTQVERKNSWTIGYYEMNSKKIAGSETGRLNETNFVDFKGARTRTNTVRNNISTANYGVKSRYQLLSVKCNQNNFDSLVGKSPSAISYKSSNSAFSYAVTRDNSILWRTSRQSGSGEVIQDNFWSSQASCMFRCTPEVLSPPVAYDGTANAITSDGATSGRILKYSTGPRNEFNFFRDNNEREIRLAKSIATGTGWKSELIDSRLQANSTGTPGLDLTTFSPALNSPLKDHNKFSIKSSWSSDDGKPWTVSALWKFKMTPNNMPKVPEGLGSSGQTGAIDGENVNAYVICPLGSPYSTRVESASSWDIGSGVSEATQYWIDIFFVRSLPTLDN